MLAANNRIEFPITDAGFFLDDGRTLVYVHAVRNRAFSAVWNAEP